MLDFRADELDAARQAVAQEEQKRLALVNRIAEYDAAIAQALQEEQEARASLNPITAQHFPNYLWRLKQQRAEVHQQLQAQEKVLLQVRETLKQAHIKVKTLEHLKEKEHTRYQKQLEKHEEAFLSEIALNRHYRK